MPSLSAATESSSSVSEISIEELGLFKIFDGLPDDKLAKIRSIMELERRKTDEVVIQDADVGDTFYLLLEGEVEVSKALVMRMSRQEVDQTDKSLIQLSSDPHPEFGKPAFGEMALFSETCKRSATVTTTRSSVLGVIQHCRFIELCESDHEIG